MLAQGMAEYSALTALADGVQHASMAIQELLGRVDNRILWIGGAVLIVWVVRKIL